MLIFSVNADFNLLDSGLLPQKTVFDRSTFTDSILRCHMNCGDAYHSCFFLECDPNLKFNFLADMDGEKKENVIEDYPSLWSRIVYFFSLGFFESLQHEKKSSLKSSLEQAVEEDSVSQQICLENCTSIFRMCYKRCICDANPTNAECNPVIKVYPQTYAPLQKYRHGKVSSNEGNDREASYFFDWSKFP